MASNVKAQVAEAQKKIDLAKNNYTAELKTNKGPIRLTFLPEVPASAGPLSMLGAGGATASTVHVRLVAADALP